MCCLNSDAFVCCVAGAEGFGDSCGGCEAKSKGKFTLDPYIISYGALLVLALGTELTASSMKGIASTHESLGFVSRCMRSTCSRVRCVLSV